MTIYKWPPVGLAARPVFTVRDPVQSSRSILTGARRASKYARRRLYAEYSVSARKRDSGAGYMEALKSLLEGGADNFVELRYRRESTLNRRPRTLNWTYNGQPLAWETTVGEPLQWTAVLTHPATLTDDKGFPAVVVPGFTQGEIVCRAGEYLRIGDEYRTCVVDTWAVNDGTATIRIDSAFPEAGPVELGAEIVATFEVLEFPETGGPLSSDYTYDWSFRQVFPDEIGDHLLLNPWST